MKPRELLIRCYAERFGDQWVAVSLEFGLSAQAETLCGVKHKLDSQIREYVHDALVGEDREHAQYLLKRRAAWQDFAKYHLICLRDWVSRRNDREGKVELFTETMPLQPA